MAILKKDSRIDNRHLEKMTLRESQLAALETLKEVDKICNKIGVQYFLMFGTLIGAIRHKGFIPWDDDLDIAMLRPDYDKFVNYCINHKLEGYSIDNYLTIKGIPFGITRFCNLNYLVEFNRYSSYKTSGAFIDIYPFDGLGPSGDLWWNEHDKERFELFIDINLAGLQLTQRKNVLTFLYRLPRALMKKYKGTNFYIEKLNNLSQHFTVAESDFVYYPMWLEVPKIIKLKKEYFSDCIKTDFENFSAPIPRGYDEILKEIYGNYLELPPENERHTEHGYVEYRIVDNH